MLSKFVCSWMAPSGLRLAPSPTAFPQPSFAMKILARRVSNPVPRWDHVHHSFPPCCPTQPRAYMGLGRGLSKIWSEEGLKGLWRGTTAALLREASYSSIRMGAYEPFKQVLGNNRHTRQAVLMGGYGAHPVWQHCGRSNRGPLAIGRHWGRKTPLTLPCG